jgi:hypothetical protein
MLYQGQQVMNECSSFTSQTITLFFYYFLFFARASFPVLEMRKREIKYVRVCVYAHMCENMVRIIVKHTLIMIQIYLGEEIMMRSFFCRSTGECSSHKASKQASNDRSTMMMMLIMSRDENIFFH